MIVFRIEDKNKNGPYYHCTSNWETTLHCDFDYNHPGHRVDKILKLIPVTKLFHTKWKYGFENKKALLKWFDKNERTNLLELGYKIKKYEVIEEKDIIYGDKQLLFRKI